MMNFKNVIFKQRGQAMVEYAILLILMVTLIMGGLELSVTAYNSKKTGDAAEAGANAWAEAISFSKANPTDSSELSSSQFERLLEQERQALNIDTDTDIGEVSDITADQERPSLNSSCIGDVGFSVEPTNLISLPIDITRCDPVVKSKSKYDPSTDPDSDANTLNGIRALVLDLYPTAGGEYRALDPYYDFITICTRNDATTGNVEKIVECKTNRNAIANVDVFDTDTAPTDGIQDACATPPIPPLTSCSDGIEDDETDNGGLDSDDPTYKKLLVLKELKNTEEYNAATSASTPTQQGVVVRRSLGNHNPTNFVRPSCNALGAAASANDYDNGLPDTTSIYLFNPLPIDISNCNGNDPFRLNRTRMSILMDGYQDPAPTATVAAANNPAGDQSVEGLLAVNTAAFSEYTKVCVTETTGVIKIVNCNNPPFGALTWLKPPGKMCGAGTTSGTEFCPGIGNLNGATGFYFFGRTNDAVENTLTDPEILATFRPAFQIVCDGASSREANTDASGACLANGTGSFALEVHTRYRSIFESFLTFGFNRLANANLAQYFYNPNGVGTSGALVGAAGSELGPVESIANPIPSLKKIKDFRGCYRVDVSPPDKIGEQVKTAVSSCN